jgi:predicted dehydrogenase
MVRCAIVGLGRWGQTLVNSVQGKSDKIRFVRGVTRTPRNAATFAADHGFPLDSDYEAALADPKVDAVVLATPPRSRSRAGSRGRRQMSRRSAASG